MIPWTVANQAPLSTGFPRQECWSWLPFPSPEDLYDSGVESGSPALQADSSPSELEQENPQLGIWNPVKLKGIKAAHKILGFPIYSQNLSLPFLSPQPKEKKKNEPAYFIIDVECEKCEK